MTKDLILFFYPKVDESNINKNLPVPFLKLGSHLTSAGYNIEIIDSRLDDNYRLRLKELAPRAAFFCVSAMTGYQIKGGLEASKLIKALNPRIKVIWGGWHASLLSQQTIENDYIDVIVRGQGETVLKELITALLNNGNLSQVQGISFKDENKNIIHSPDRPFEDVNNFASINFDILGINKYVHKSYLGQRTIVWNTSQGCPFRCAYCSTNKVYKRMWSGFKAERVLDEIGILVNRFAVDGVSFVEDNFFVDRQRVEKICNGLIEKNINLNWEVDGRVDQIVKFDDKFLELLKKSGCRKIYVGAETGDESVLALIDKDIKLADTYKAAQILSRHNIIVEMFLMVGFPENPKQDLKKTLELLRNIKSLYPNHQATAFVYTPYPGSRLFEIAVEKGLKAPKRLADWSSWSMLSVTTPWINKKYKDSVDMLVKFYFPFAFPSDSLRRVFAHKRWGLFYRMLHHIAKFRVENNLFILPIEWYIISYIYYHIKLKYNIFAGTSVPR